MQATGNPEAKGPSAPLPELPEYRGFKILKSVVLYGEVGCGSLGMVYRGRFLNIGVDIALRHLNPQFAKTTHEFSAQLPELMKHATVARFANLVTYYECFEHLGHLFVATEFVDGETCPDRMERKGRLDLGEALKIGIETVRAISATHSWGVIHGNLHPGQILITPGGQVKVTDAGLVPALRAATGCPGLLLAPVSLDYQAPEKIPSRVADVYALGATLYYLLTGVHPTPDAGGSASNPMKPSVLQAAAHLDMRELAEVAPPRIVELIEQATCEDPERRPANATELLADLERHSDGLEVDLADAEAGSTSQHRQGYRIPQMETLSEMRAMMNELTVATRLRSLSASSAAKKPYRRALNAALVLAAVTFVALAGFVFVAPQGEAWKRVALERIDELVRLGSQSIRPKVETAPPTRVTVTYPREESMVPSGVVTCYGKLGNGLVSDLTINGVPAVITQTEWSAEVEIRAGVNQLAVRVVNDRGEAQQSLLRVDGGIAPDWADAKAGTTCDPETRQPYAVVHRETGIEFVFVPAGTYLRGASPGDPDAQEDETPRHPVQIKKAFYLGRCEVTNAQYQKSFASHKGGTAVGFSLDDASQPVTAVGWNEAVAFCKAWGFRLPTEAEWEYACRAGSTSRYPWGDSPDEGQGAANVFDLSGARLGFTWNSFPFDDGAQVATTVGRFKPNALGLCDMIGNVWEWCADDYDALAYEAFVKGLKLHGVKGVHVLRGGSWYDRPSSCRASTRNGGDVNLKTAFVGFRVARDL